MRILSIKDTYFHIFPKILLRVCFLVVPSENKQNLAKKK